MLVNEGQLTERYINVYSLHESKIGVPIFQRFYDWKEKQTDALLDDLLNVAKDPSRQIYLLDFIYYEDGGKINLADGQQRVVTINLLMKAINDHIQSAGLDIQPLDLFDISYDIQQYDKKYRNCFFNYPVAPFKKNYLYFEKWISENEELLPRIIDAIKNNIFVFVKKTASIDDAFNVFQQINTGGKSLSKDEVISSTVSQFADIYHIPVEAKVKELKKMISAYYKYLYSSNAGDFDTLSIMSFLRKDVVATREQFQKFARTLNVLNSLSDNPIASVINYINRPQLFDILNIMGMEHIDIFRQAGYLSLVMSPLCLLSIVMTMKKANPGGIIKTLYSSVIDLVKSHQSPITIGACISRFINDNPEICKIGYRDFEKALGSPEIKMGIKKAILIIDVIMRNTTSTLNVNAVNLEHIYPQKPDDQWAIEGWPTSRDDQRLLIDNIGNFMLLNEEVNKRIKNRYIDYKRPEYDRIWPNDLSLQTTMNTVDFDRFKNEKGAYIQIRQKEIARLVYETFKLGNVMIVRE